MLRRVAHQVTDRESLLDTRIEKERTHSRTLQPSTVHCTADAAVADEAGHAPMRSRPGNTRTPRSAKSQNKGRVSPTCPPSKQPPIAAKRPVTLGKPRPGDSGCGAGIPRKACRSQKVLRYPCLQDPCLQDACLQQSGSPTRELYGVFSMIPPAMREENRTAGMHATARRTRKRRLPGTVDDGLIYGQSIPVRM